MTIIALLLCIAFQLHLSAAELLVPFAVGIVIARPRIQPRYLVLTALIVLVCFLPLYMSEETQQGVIADAVAGNSSSVPASERFSYNENAWWGFFLHTRLQMYQGGMSRVGFSALDTVQLNSDEYLGSHAWLAAQLINRFCQLQMLLWWAGAAFCLWSIWRHMRYPCKRTAKSRRRMIIGSVVLAWQLVNPIFMTFFNYHGYPKPMSLAPLRYYVVSYPAPFITSAIGIVGLFRAANRWRSSLPWARILVTFCWLLVFVQLVFAVMYLSLLRHSGRMLPYGDNYAPTLAMMLNARELLLREARIDRDAWFNRVHSDGFGTLGWGECSLDWLITQDERSLQSPSPDPHLRWVFTGSRTPAPQGKAIRRWALLPGDLCLLEYRVDDRETTIPDNTSMRNPYFAMRPMRYLGPDESLRKATPPPPFRPGEMEL